mmetsp:Transcript_6542/g.16226  ORF Transcript_6542/g.16226 Transcript_6542/m.16226 type:complete len:153 (+) Transcript_6542:274-732(+)
MYNTGTIHAQQYLLLTSSPLLYTTRASSPVRRGQEVHDKQGDESSEGSRMHTHCSTDNNTYYSFDPLLSITSTMSSFRNGFDMKASNPVFLQRSLLSFVTSPDIAQQNMGSIYLSPSYESRKFFSQTLYSFTASSPFITGMFKSKNATSKPA